MIDASADQIDAYAGAIAEIRAAETEGNDAVRKLVEDFNSKIEQIYKSVLGDKIDLAPIVQEKGEEL